MIDECCFSSVINLLKVVGEARTHGPNHHHHYRHHTTAIIIIIIIIFPIVVIIITIITFLSSLSLSDFIGANALIWANKTADIETLQAIRKHYKAVVFFSKALKLF